MKFRSDKFSLATLLIAALMAYTLSAGAGVAAEGSLNAVSYRPIPPHAGITVRPWDNSDDNLALAKAFEDVLREKGYWVTDNAPLVLSFETRDILGQWSAGERRSIIDLEGGGGRGGGENTRAMLNLYESERGGVLNQGREPGDVVPSKYQLDVTLDERSGSRLWQGQATAELIRTTGQELTLQMISVLVQNLGQTVKQGTFPVR